ncbi:MAG: hypothetical protein HY301_10470 [Verrucomicrobia bacterium]|nr:hypothetical protein [Verrucomicrobiota bacterium]
MLLAPSTDLKLETDLKAAIKAVSASVSALKGARDIPAAAVRLYFATRRAWTCLLTVVLLSDNPQDPRTGELRLLLSKADRRLDGLKGCRRELPIASYQKRIGHYDRLMRILEEEGIEAVDRANRRAIRRALFKKG